MNPLITSAVVKFMDQLGYKIIPKWRVKNFEIATHTRKLINLFGINCVLDVGANLGQYGEFLRTEVGYTGQILSFEPVKRVFNQLKLNSRKDPLWYVYPFAFGSENGNININITKSDRLNSFLHPKESGLLLENYNIDDSNSIIGSESVEVKTIDSFFEEENSIIDLKNSHIFLKLDTQGYDTYVINGGKNTLSKIYAIQSEISCIPIYQGMEDYIKSLEKLRILGFDVTGMFPVSRDQWNRVVEFDFLGINRNKII